MPRGQQHTGTSPRGQAEQNYDAESEARRVDDEFESLVQAAKSTFVSTWQELLNAMVSDMQQVFQEGTMGKKELGVWAANLRWQIVSERNDPLWQDCIMAVIQYIWDEFWGAVEYEVDEKEARRVEAGANRYSVEERRDRSFAVGRKVADVIMTTWTARKLNVERVIELVHAKRMAKGASQHSLAARSPIGHLGYRQRLIYGTRQQSVLGQT